MRVVGVQHTRRLFTVAEGRGHPFPGRAFPPGPVPPLHGHGLACQPVPDLLEVAEDRLEKPVHLEN